MPTQDQTERFVAELTGSQDRLFTYILSLLPDPHRARDVPQETNLVLWRKHAEFEPGTNFAAWACRVAQFQVKAAWRDMSRETGRLLFNDDVLNVLADDALQISSGAQARRDALRSCLAKLAPDQRAMIRDRYESNDSVQTIAAARDRTENAVSIALHRVRKSLAECIEKTLDAEGSS